MRAGELRHRINIDEPVVTQNATGELVPDWQTRAKVWAAVEPLEGREALLAGGITDTMNTRIRIRWSPTVNEMTARWRIRHEDTVYNIVSIAHLKLGRREIEVMAQSGANDG